MDLNNPVITAKKIFRETLKARIYDVVERTPLDKAHKLSKRYENQIYSQTNQVCIKNLT